MANGYLLSIREIFNKFDPNLPKTFEQVIKDFGDDVFGLTLDGDSLYRFVNKMERDGSLIEKEGGYVLTQDGLRDLEEIKEWIEHGVSLKKQKARQSL